MPHLRQPASTSIIVTAAAVLYLLGCDSTSSEEPTTTLTPNGRVVLTVGDWSVEVDSSGAVRNGRWQDLGLFYDTGLWMAGPAGGEVRDLVRLHATSNYGAYVEGEQVGVYHLDPERLGGEVTGWSSTYGAPTDAHGQPLLLGDEMAWSALFPAAPEGETSDIYTHPLSDVRITQSVFGYEEGAAEQVFFVRGGDRKVLMGSRGLGRML